MELHPEYIRDMHSHYMVLKGNKGYQLDYTAKMLMNNSVFGILKTEIRYLDSLDLYYYDITSKRTLKSIYESKSLDYPATQKLIENILQIIENSEEFLLVEHDFIITQEYIFLDDNMEVALCYLPGFSNNVLKQLSYLFEYVMNKIDYKDEAAVRLIYALYKESKDVECMFYKLYEIIEYPYFNERTARQEVTKNKENWVSGLMEEERNKKTLVTSSNDIQKINGDKVWKSKNKKENSIGNISKNSEGKSRVKSRNDKDIIKAKNRAGSKDCNEVNKNNEVVRDYINRIRYKLFPLITAVDNGNDPKIHFKNDMRNVDNKRNSKTMPQKYHVNLETDKNEIINEKEIFYYGKVSYILAGGCIFAGIIIVCIIYFSGIVSSSLRNSVDSVKLFACVLVTICIEIYIMTKIFDSNKKLTKMETVLEYINIDEGENIGSSKIDNINIWENINNVNPEDLFSNEKPPEKMMRVIREETIGEMRERIGEGARGKTGDEMTQILWADDCYNKEENTQVLAFLGNTKSYYLIPIKAKASEQENMIKVKLSESPFYIGKNPDMSNMVIEERSISRKHAVITFKDEKIFLTDLDSTNGTFINGNRLKPNQACSLAPFDQVSFANIKYLLEELEE